MIGMSRKFLFWLCAFLTIMSPANACIIPAELDYSAFNSSEIVVVARTLELRDGQHNQNNGFYQDRHLILAIDEVLAGNIGSVAEAYAQKNVLGYADRGDTAWLDQPLIVILKPQQFGTSTQPWTAYRVPKQICGHPYVLKGTEENVALIKSWISGAPIDPSKLDVFDEDLPLQPLMKPVTFWFLVSGLVVSVIAVFLLRSRMRARQTAA